MRYLESFFDMNKFAKVGDQVICIDSRIEDTSLNRPLRKNKTYTVEDVIQGATIYYILKEDPHKISWKASRFKVRRLEDIKKFDL